MSAHDVTALAHESIAAALEAGGLAVDATVGNGHDTRFLARAVATWLDARRACARPLLERVASPAPRAPVLWVVQRA